MMKNSDIKETKDYSQFKVGDWNRTIKKNNMKKLDKSVKKNGWLKHPIMVNENMEIMDGQHRFVYARENNLPVYYVVIQGLSANDCVTMNNIRTAWTLMDYINFYASQGNSDYIILQDLATKYQFIPPTTLLAVIKTAATGGSFSGQVKTGQFTITTKEHDRAVKKLNFLSDLSVYILGVPGRPSALFSSVAFAFDCPGIDRERLSRQIKENAEKEGIVVKLWLENMDFGEFMKEDGGVSTPLIQIDAHANFLTHAAVCLALEDVIEKLKKSDPMVGAMLEALKHSRCGQREVDMRGE